MRRRTKIIVITVAIAAADVITRGGQMGRRRRKENQEVHMGRRKRASMAGQQVIPTSPHVLARKSDPETSHAGARAVSPKTPSQKALLREQYAVAGAAGLTDEEAALMTGRLSISPGWGYWKRCSNLREDGHIVPTGETRLNRSKSPAEVCRITDEGRAAL